MYYWLLKIALLRPHKTISNVYYIGMQLFNRYQNLRSIGIKRTSEFYSVHSNIIYVGTNQCIRIHVVVEKFGLNIGIISGRINNCKTTIIIKSKNKKESRQPKKVRQMLSPFHKRGRSPISRYHLISSINRQAISRLLLGIGLWTKGAR